MISKKPFTNYETLIEEGSLILLHLSHRSTFPLTVKRGESFQHMSGMFYHDSMIGKRYGATIHTHNNKASAILLHPTCEKWTASLPHRTQIIYTPDIAMISAMLDLQDGMRVVESGTGSASLTHSLARAVYPNGHVFTFEYHERRFQIAQQEFIAHGLSDTVTITHGNVCAEGFQCADEDLRESVHAVILDLPEPWKALPHVPQLFRPDRTGRICCFSPCIEQVEKTRATLVQLGFTDIEMVECLQKTHEPRVFQFDAFGSGKSAKRRRLARGVVSSSKESDDQNKTAAVTVTATPQEAKGHSAFLTFASYLPAIVP